MNDQGATVEDALAEALRELTAIIEKAGLLNLSNGVQLGQTSWYVKASDRMREAQEALARYDALGGAETRDRAVPLGPTPTSEEHDGRSVSAGRAPDLSVRRHEPGASDGLLEPVRAGTEGGERAATVDDGGSGSDGGSVCREVGSVIRTAPEQSGSA